MKRNKKSVRGVSLVEVVVALTVVLIIASASISLLISHASAEQRATMSYKAASYASSTIDCYRNAENNSDDFTASLTRLFGEDNLTVSEGVYTARVDGVVISVATHGDGTLEYVANSEGGKLLYETDYIPKMK